MKLQQDDSPGKGSLCTVAQKKATMAGVVEEFKVLTFEDIFFRKMFLCGSQDLTDPALRSIMALDQSGLCVEEFQGKTYVFSRGKLIDRTRAKIRKQKQTGQDRQDRSVMERKMSCALKELERQLKKRRNPQFSFTEFYQKYNLPMDKISSFFPMTFKSYRLVLHSLKAAYALLGTLEMFKFDGNLSQPTVMVKGRRIYRMKKSNLLSLLFQYIYKGLEKLHGGKPESEIYWIKTLKNSLCFFVSKAMKQHELPEGNRIDLFPPTVHQWYNRLNESERVRFAFSCLQSKCIFQEVPDTFVQKELRAHRDKLSSNHRGLSKEFLERLREEGRLFGKVVFKYYKPEKSFPASNKATYSFPRQKGGVKGDLVYHDRLSVSSASLPVLNPDDRPEPLVLGLFGQPGQGKSSRLYEIVSSFRHLFKGVKDADLVYQRTCNVKHWDGYRQQPIVILDDLGQSKSGEDIQEFQTLVSCNPYVLPMASLNEKGCLFASPIIICTSNLPYGCQLSSIYGVDQTPIIDQNSFWRRFHIPVYVEGGIYHILREPVDFVRENHFLYREDGTRKKGDRTSHRSMRYPHIISGVPTSDTDRILGPSGSLTSSNGGAGLFLEYKSGLWMSVDFRELLKICHETYRSRSLFARNIAKYWEQTVFSTRSDFLSRLRQLSEDHPTSQFPDLFESFQAYESHKIFEKPETSIDTKYVFPAFPPEGPLPVRVEPIKEPLKVRTITAGIGDTFCLKPFQRAMWEALDEFPQFTLTHGTDRLCPAIEKIYKKSKETDVWISGDYSAATDSVDIQASEALLSGILESIDHQPTKRWAMKEVSAHLLVYPEGSGIAPVLQKSGQLMGSLLSFPLLCLLNNCTAKFIGLKPDSYLINGDDILMRCPEHKYPEWKEMTQQLGFTLSAGKNYVSRTFGTVNSQIIQNGEVMPSGKQTVLCRSNKVLGESLRDLELFMESSESEEIKSLFKRFNRPLLSKTVRSIHVPSSFGGLGFSWGSDSESNHFNNYLIYYHELFKKIDPGNREVLVIPYLSFKNLSDDLTLRGKLELFEQVVGSEEYHEDFLHSHHLKKTLKRIHGNKIVRDNWKSRPLKDMIPLSCVQTIEIPMGEKDYRGAIQNEIFNYFLSRVVVGDYMDCFTYSEYRQGVIRQLMGLKKDKNSSETALLGHSVEYLVPLFETSLSEDALPYLDLEQPIVNYSKEWFQEELEKKNCGKSGSCDLVPKNGIPDQHSLKDYYSEPEYLDYSQLVEFHFQNLANSLTDLEIDLPPEFMDKYSNNLNGPSR